LGALARDSAAAEQAQAAPAPPSATAVPPGEKKMGHPIVYFEIGCRDHARTEHFFGELFGWHIQPNGPASMIDTGSQQGIPGHITALGHEPQHYTIFYVEVDDIQASLDKAI